MVARQELEERERGRQRGLVMAAQLARQEERAEQAERRRLAHEAEQAQLIAAEAESSEARAAAAAVVAAQRCESGLIGTHLVGSESKDGEDEAAPEGKDGESSEDGSSGDAGIPLRSFGIGDGGLSTSETDEDEDDEDDRNQEDDDEGGDDEDEPGDQDEEDGGASSRNLTSLAFSSVAAADEVRGTEWGIDAAKAPPGGRDGFGGGFDDGDSEPADTGILAGAATPPRHPPGIHARLGAGGLGERPASAKAVSPPPAREDGPAVEASRQQLMTLARDLMARELALSERQAALAHREAQVVRHELAVMQARIAVDRDAAALAAREHALAARSGILQAVAGLPGLASTPLPELGASPAAQGALLPLGTASLSVAERASPLPDLTTATSAFNVSASFAASQHSPGAHDALARDDDSDAFGCLTRDTGAGGLGSFDPLAGDMGGISML